MSDSLLNVLFVDDEQKILDGLRRQLRIHREHWEMRFATSGDQALTMLAECPADIIVSDMRMAGMNGGQLLARVCKLYPQTTRIMLSGQTDQADLMAELGCIHQYLQKPCDDEMLCSSIERARSLAAQLNHPALRLAASRVTALPPGSETYRALVAELINEDAKLPVVANLVADDPALTAKLMQLVNSAFFGMPRKINSPHDAVVLLGLKMIHGIVVSGRLFDFAAHSSPAREVLSQIWLASLEIAKSAAKLAKENGEDETTSAQVWLAGLLSLIGRVILLAQTPESFEQVKARVISDSIDYAQSEKLVYGTTQDEVAAYALGLWGFSDEVIEAIAFQSHPALLPAGKINRLVAYLHVARSLHKASGDGMDAGPTLDSAYLAQIGFGLSKVAQQKAAA